MMSNHMFVIGKTYKELHCFLKSNTSVQVNSKHETILLKSLTAQNIEEKEISLGLNLEMWSQK